MYISSKPAKYGLKNFAMCDVKTFYTSNLEVYTGSFRVSNSPIDIVTQLVKLIENSNRNLTTGNWYSSFPPRIFWRRRITFIGTICKNSREISPEFLPSRNRELQSLLFGFEEKTTLVSYVSKIKQLFYYPRCTIYQRSMKQHENQK